MVMMIIVMRMMVDDTDNDKQYCNLVIIFMTWWQMIDP